MGSNRLLDHLRAGQVVADARTAQAYLNAGCRLLSVGGDTLFLRQGSAAARDMILGVAEHAGLAMALKSLEKNR